MFMFALTSRLASLNLFWWPTWFCVWKVLQVENIPQVVDHNSNYQTLPTNVRQSAEQATSAQLSRYDDKIANSESDLQMPDKPTKTSNVNIVKEPGSALAPVVKAVSTRWSFGFYTFFSVVNHLSATCL